MNANGKLCIELTNKVNHIPIKSSAAAVEVTETIYVCPSTVSVAYASPEYIKIECA